jgi:hypothetical protein
MKSKTLLSLIFLACFQTLAYGQDFKERFTALFAEDDTSGQTQVLTEWEKATPKDPELFIAYFNYYARKSRKEIVSLGTTPQGGEQLVLSDTTGGEPVGFLGTATSYDGKTLKMGFEYINKGLAMYPDRLDMRFGKIYMLGESGSYAEFTTNVTDA